jgi:phage-related protein
VKAAVFHPAARAAIRLFPAEIRKELGKAIYDLQLGESLSLPLSRPMSSVASGVSELRLRDRSGIYRVFCYVQSRLGILIFHAFVKKTQKTPQHELQVARRRLEELRDEKI